MRIYKKIFLVGLLIPVLLSQSLKAQDTLSINLTEFIQRGMENSGQVAYERNAIDLAENRVREARSQRIFPRLELNTQHGVVPGVVSQRNDLSEGEYYLDPNLSNDWENWAVFSRAEINAIQPIYSWGAVDSAIRAAEAGAKAAEHRFGVVEAEAQLQLFDLYYSYLLAIEISRIVEDADEKLQEVEKQMDEMREEGNPDLEESDIFKLEIFKAEFETQKVEVQQSLDYIKRIWDYALQADTDVTYVPDSNFLDPVPYELEDFEFYRQQAMESRPEMKGIESGITAMANRVDAVRAQQYPMLFLGITGRYAFTPNRPRQTNPFIINNSNYASAGVGFGIRQNLNIFSMKTEIQKAEIEYNRVNNLQKSVSDQIILDLNERYREAVVADTRMKQTDEALVTARRWVRNEQLNYDIGFGDVEDLLDAVQKELELRLKLKQNIFELNKKVAALYKSAGLSFTHLNLN